MLQHVSIIIQIIFSELICSLLKSLNLKYVKNIKSLVCVRSRTHTKRYAAASPHLTFYMFNLF